MHRYALSQSHIATGTLYDTNQLRNVQLTVDSPIATAGIVVQVEEFPDFFDLLWVFQKSTLLLTLQ